MVGGREPGRAQGLSSHLPVSLTQSPGAHSFKILKGVLEDYALRYAGGARPGWVYPHHPLGHRRNSCVSGFSPAVPVRRLPLLKRAGWATSGPCLTASDHPVKYELGHFSVTNACLTEPPFRHPVSALVADGALWLRQPDNDRFRLLARLSGEFPPQAWACRGNACLAKSVQGFGLLHLCFQMSEGLRASRFAFHCPCQGQLAGVAWGLGGSP